MRTPMPVWTVAVLIVLLVGGLAAATHAPSSVSRPTGARAFVGTDSVVTTNRYGGYTSTYYAGLGSGEVYFAANDASGDHTAVVQINDKNATRDHLSNPVASWTVNVVPGYNDSYTWGTYYQIPVTLVYGGEWNITISGATAGFNFLNFTVVTFYSDISLSTYSSLPGHAITATVTTFWEANDALFGSLTNVEMTAEYETTSHTYVALPGTPTSLGNGSIATFHFTVPLNAITAVYLYAYANATTGGANLTATSGGTLNVGLLAAPLVTLSDCPGSCPTSAFAQGTPIYIRVIALSTASGSPPANGVNVNLQYERGSSAVTPAGAPTTIPVNQQGLAQATVLASVPPFSRSGINTISVTVTDPSDSSDSSVATNTSFTIYNTTVEPTLQVTLSSNVYYGGDTATAKWSVGGNASVVKGWMPGEYWVNAYYSGNLWAVGSLASGSSTATTGSFSVALPANFTGVFEVYVTIHNATDSLEAYAEAQLDTAALVLTASELHYSPGDTITVTATPFGSIVQSATIWATVQDDNGNWVFNAMVHGGQFSFPVPSQAPPSYYEIYATAQSSTLGTVANYSLELTLQSGVDLNLGVSTASNYVDGSYQPGETISISYQLIARGTAALPSAFELAIRPYTVSAETGQYEEIVALTGTSGTFSYTIPSDSATGNLFLYASASLGGPSCVVYCSTYTYLVVDVNSHPAALSYQVGNTGFTLGGLIFVVVLILLILVAVVLVWHRRRGKRGGMQPYQAAPPTATAGGSGSSPPSGGSGSPPP